MSPEINATGHFWKHGTESGRQMHFDNRRDSRLLSLFSSDTLNCVPQMMCELISAKEPGPATGTINDYKYLLKELLK